MTCQGRSDDTWLLSVNFFVLQARLKLSIHTQCFFLSIERWHVFLYYGIRDFSTLPYVILLRHCYGFTLHCTAAYFLFTLDVWIYTNMHHKCCHISYILFHVLAMWYNHISTKLVNGLFPLFFALWISNIAVKDYQTYCKHFKRNLYISNVPFTCQTYFYLYLYSYLLLVYYFSIYIYKKSIYYFRVYPCYKRTFLFSCKFSF